MKFNVSPMRLGILVMKNDRELDPSATTQIREHRRIALKRIQDAYSFRPILQVQVDAPRKAGEVIQVARFYYRKDNAPILIYDLPKELTRDTVFYPTVVPDLSSYRSTPQGATPMLGWWEVETSLAFVGKQEFETALKERQKNFLHNLRYQTVGKFRWEVANRSDPEITATGQLEKPSDKPASNISLDMSDI